MSYAAFVSQLKGNIYISAKVEPFNLLLFAFFIITLAFFINSFAEIFVEFAFPLTRHET